MAQDILEAIKEEIDLLREIEMYYREEEKNNKETSFGDKLYLHRVKERRMMLNRIVQRVEKGLHYRLGIKEGKVRIIAE